MPERSSMAGFDFTSRFSAYRERIEQVLADFLPSITAETGGLVVEAARYSLLGGGKRLRPVLLLAVVELLSGDASSLDRALPFAAAIEMIHTYSLIHDDLPCMDDDQLRRGQPTCHVAFGEAIAVLAGDLLLNRAAELMLSRIDPGHPGTLAAARLIMHASGEQGMIGGQVLDLQAENQQISLDALQRLHRMKTGALLLAPVQAAIELVRPVEDRSNLRHLATSERAQAYAALVQYGEATGLAFQIQDDILDGSSSSDVMGKTIGKDERDLKSTYVTLLGRDQAIKHLQATLETAGQALLRLRGFSLETTFLSGLIDYLLVRKS